MEHRIRPMNRRCTGHRIFTPIPGFLALRAVLGRALDAVRNRTGTKEKTLCRVEGRRVPRWLVWVASGGFLLAAQNLTEIPTVFPGIYVGSHLWVDFDNDGDLDVVLSGSDGLQFGTQLFRNDGLDEFAPVPDAFPADISGPLSAIDFDHDGHLDVSVGAILFRNAGGGRFVRSSIDIPNTGSGSFAWGDFDNDGNPDLLCSDGWSHLTLFHNDGQGHFTESNQGLTQTPGAHMDWSDFDGDGDLDFLVAGGDPSGASSLFVHRNDGRGQFSVQPVSLTDSYSTFALWADVDNDGMLDILALPFPASTFVTPHLVRQSSVTGAFLDAGLLEVSCHTQGGAVADFNNDGFTDLTVFGWSAESSQQPETWVVPQIGGGFGPPQLVTTPPGEMASWADVDRDGDLDLLVTGPPCSNFGCGAVVKLFRNDAPVANTAPSPPSELRSEMMPDGAVMLRWDQARDRETTDARGLSYDVRVGKLPGGIDVVSPPSDMLTGARRVVAAGTAHGSAWIVRGLAKGTYYWSVQAVDPSYAGSGWAVEAKFTVTNTPPTITAVAPSSDLSPSFNVNFSVNDHESLPTLLTVSASSSDARLVPASQITFSGVGAARTLQLVWEPNRFGTVTITLNVRDPQGLSGQASFNVTRDMFTEVPIDLGTNIFSPSLASNLAADFDGDGILDFAVIYLLQDGNPYDYVLAVAQNDGRGGFKLGPPVRSSTGDSTRYSIIAEDFDRDGRLDIYEAEGGFLHYNRGGGVFDPTIKVVSMANARAGDMNGDGTIDLMGHVGVPVDPPMGLDSGAQVYLNDGRFRPSGPPLDLGAGWLCHLFDSDGDGDLDILNGSHADPSDPSRMSARLFENAGTGMYSIPPLVLAPVGAADFDTWVEDEDADGDPDIITYRRITPEAPARRVRFTNDGRGHFSPTQVDPRYIRGGFDFDNDGDRDPFVGSGSGAEFRLHRNDGATGIIPLPMVLPNEGLVGDFDNDGDLDIIALVSRIGESGFPQPSLRFFRNNSDLSNTPPTTPLGLETTIHNDDRVTLSWRPASDDRTPVALLGYNLRVGTQPGAHDVVSADGRIVRTGNMGGVSFHDLRHLRPGRYYWSVQAVDGQFGLSDWAPEQSFGVFNPHVLSIQDVFTQAGVPSRPIRVDVLGESAPADQLSWSVTSEDNSLVPSGGLALSGVGLQRDLIIRPANHTGATVITVTATDTAGFSSVVQFWLHVAPFEIVPFPTPYPGPGSDFAWVDLNADGRLDLIGLGTSTAVPESGFSVFLNARDGRLEPVLAGFPSWFNGSILPGDLDGDNVPDFLLAGADYSILGSYPPEYRVWRGDGALQFAPVTPQLTNILTARTVTDRDFNGLPDVVSWGYRQALGLPLDALGDPAHGFQPLSPGTQLNYLAGVAWADLDGNGDLDLVLSGQENGGNFLRAFRYDGDGRLTMMETGLPPNMMAIVAAADVDNNGLVDLYIGPVTPDPARPSDGIPPPRIWRNLGDFRFARMLGSFPPELNAVPAWADFDNDGNLDAFLLSKLFRNDGRGNFTKMDSGIPAISSSSVAWGDADGDGDLDLFLAGASGVNQVGRFLAINASARSNTPPSVPTGLRISSAGQRTMLSWAPATDAENSGNLTYNVRVGTTSGGSQVVSASADLATGRRRLSGFGNSGSAARRLLGKLPDGSYFWTVQSVDAGFGTSPFAPEQMFKVSRPHFGGLTNLVVEANLFAGSFPFSVGDAETPSSDIKITVTSSDQTMIPEAGIAITGAGGSRNFSFTPTPHAVGMVTLAFTAEDFDGEIEVVTIQVTIRNEFSPRTTSLPGLDSASVAWGDVDRDGDLDLLLGGEGSSAIWQNEGGNLGSTRLAQFASADLGDVAFIDVNTDGILDVFVTGGAGASRLYLGEAGGIFREVAPSPFAQLTRSAVAWGDADNDGDLDAVLFGVSRLDLRDFPQLYGYANGGTGGFVQERWFNFALRDGAAAWVDIDNDGDNDLILTGSTTFNASGAQTVVYRNEEGVLAPMAHNLPPIAYSALAIADFDLDGDPDLVISGANGNGLLTKLFRNDGRGGFTQVSTALPQLSSPSLAWGDYDADGFPELILTGGTDTTFGVASGTTEIWLNSGGDILRRSGNSFSGVRQGTAAWGDSDGDGDLDLVIVGATEAAGPPFTRLYRNDLNRKLPVPPAPIDLAAETVGNDIVLSWSVPNGAPSGLSYNLRVGTAPGLEDVMSASAEVATGRRLVVANGNAGWSGRWRLRGLPLRTYYWSVQAINSGYCASPFAAESSVLAGNTRPTISDIPDQTAIMNRPVGAIAFVVADEDSDPDSLVISVRSSNPELVPEASIAVSGSGSDRVLTIAPAPNQSGISTISVTVHDRGGASTFDAFRFKVTGVSDATTPLPNVIASAIEPADFDGDGILDLFVAGREPIGPGSSRGYAAILRGDSDGKFTERSPRLPPTLSESFGAWGDYDGDGDLDLLHTGAVYRNDGGTFTKVWGELADIENGAGAWGDFDGDGRLDIAICGRPIITRIYHNDGGDQFTDIKAPLMGVWLGALSWCDPDGDGDLDLLVTGAASELVAASPFARLYRNEGGAFVEDRVFFGVVNGSIAWGDVNGDGKPDLLYSGTHGAVPAARLYFNMRGGGFAEAPLPSGGIVFPGSTLVDWDRNGDLDFARYTSSAFGIHFNDGLGAFDGLAGAFDNARARVLRTGDFDNDGDADLIVAGSTSAGLPSSRLYLNPRVSLPPFSPDGLTSIVEGDSVMLSWPDDHAFGSGGTVSYNLRVGSVPSSSDVINSMSILATGRRLLPQAGNTGTLNFRRLRRLLPGTYYWSVQTVDGTFNASLFAPESTFIVAPPPRAPTIISISVVAGTQARMTVVGRPGVTMLLERSTDLHLWSAIGSYQLDAEGKLTWTGAGAASIGFFRFTETP
jgi:FG-GAP-like repeat